jgi:phosphoserine aminotransferase
MKEAKKFGKVNVVATSEDKNFSYIPKNLKFTADASYAHITTNNTIEGTEYATIPNTGNTPLIADASSDILARQLDYSRFDVIYAGAQKNMGPAGVTLVVMRKSFLDKAREDIPAVLSYKTHAKADSLYNTPPAFGVYIVGLVLKWMEEQGGIKAVETNNRKKADLIYAAIDEFPGVYDPAVTSKEDRSLMNITFRLKNVDKEKDFLAGAQELGMDGLKGHRSVGGFRASVYNAFPLEGAKALAKHMTDFAKRQ